MLDENVVNHQKRLRDEIKELKAYLSLFEHEVNSSDHVARLSDDQFQNINRKLQTATNCVCNANSYWAYVTHNKELEGKLVDLDLKLTREQFRPTNQIFPSLPMTEESATAVAEKIQEAAKKGN